MNQSIVRIASFLVGVALIAAAMWESADVHDAAVASILAVGGIAAIMYALIYDRLRKAGPQGIELDEFKDQTVTLLRMKVEPELAQATERRPTPATDATPHDPAAGTGSALDATTQTTETVHATAAALISAAETPEELATAIVKIADLRSLEPRDRNVVRLEAERAIRDERSGPSTGSRGRPPSGA